jgi:hypothetical protein
MDKSGSEDEVVGLHHTKSDDKERESDHIESAESIPEIAPVTIPPTIIHTAIPIGKKGRFILLVLGLTIFYWAFSGGLTFFNKWFFSTRGFHFPILVVMGTLIVHSILSTVVRLIRYQLAVTNRHRAARLLPKTQSVDSVIYLKYLVPIGLFTGLEIASSNLALVLLSVVSFVFRFR